MLVLRSGGDTTAALALFLAILLASAAAECSQHSDCPSCTGDSTWAGACRWCPVDGKCYSSVSGALHKNPCRRSWDITKAGYCVESCRAPLKMENGPETCTFYTSASANISSNPDTWLGGDFLLASYGKAARCACSGGSNPLWLAPTPSCIRTRLQEYHRGLNATVKRAMRAASRLPLIERQAAWQAFVPAVYAMHQKAYDVCGCTGRPAPLVSWRAIMIGGGAAADISCRLITTAILEAGRCGCGAM